MCIYMLYTYRMYFRKETRSCGISRHAEILMEDEDSFFDGDEIGVYHTLMPYYIYTLIVVHNFLLSFIELFLAILIFWGK